MFKSKGSFKPGSGKGGLMDKIRSAMQKGGFSGGGGKTFGLSNSYRPATPQRPSMPKTSTMTAGANSPSAPPPTMKKGGYVKAADGCAQRGKTKGRFV